MTAADGVLAAILLGLTAYAILGGADFGGGVWDLLATGPRRDAQRGLIARSMGPVWEANHVWLVFVIIGLFSGFPRAFGVLSRVLVLPLALALLGIVLRGAAFAYRQYGRPDPAGRAVRGTVVWGRVFAVASTITPFVLGVAGAAVATGQLPADGSAGALAPFRSPLPLLAGALALATCAFLAAVFLCRDAEMARAGPGLVADFRRRALAAAALAGGLALAGLPVMWADAPALAGRFDRAVVPAVGSVLAGAAALILLWHRRFGAARVAAAAAPTGLLWGWGLAQYPWLAVGAVDVASGAAPPATSTAILVVLATGMILVTPALALLLRMVRRAGPIERFGDASADSRDVTSPAEA
ncbi:MAG: cytochrome bd ubiquinol oxidase subunit [Mycobacteriales bacterium]